MSDKSSKTGMHSHIVTSVKTLLHVTNVTTEQGSRENITAL